MKQINQYSEITEADDDDLLIIQPKNGGLYNCIKKSNLLQGVTTGSSASGFNYIGGGDKRGLIYWLGTNGYTSSFTNPAFTGKITATSSSNWANSNPAANLFGRDQLTAHTANSANEWFKLDIGATRSFRLASYTVMNRTDNASQYPRNWRLEGSNNDTTWVIIDNQINNRTLSDLGVWCFADTFDNANFYRYFRLVNTGLNSNNERYFVLGEWELYGVLA